MSKINKESMDSVAVIEAAELESADKVSRNYATMKDEQLGDCMFSRGLDVPLDENGRIMRKVAIQRIIKWDEDSKPLNAHRRMRVIFHRTGREEESPYVFLSLNGIAFQVPYEQEVSLPEPVVRGCCDDAIMTVNDYKGVDLEKGMAIYAERTVHTVPYTFLGYEEASMK